MSEQEQKDLTPALAEYLGISVEAVKGFVVSVEHEAEDGLRLTSIWSTGTPVWRLLSFAREIVDTLKNLR